MRFVIEGVKPMGSVRMTRRGKFTSEAAQRYLAYKNVLEMAIFEQTDFSQKMFAPGEPLHVTLIFKMPIPDSYSLKKKRELPGTPHVKKADIDNLIKGVFDSINGGVAWHDDNQVSSVTATKVYATEPGIEIFIERIEGEQQ